MINTNLKKLRTAATSLIILVTLSSLDAFGMEKENEFSKSFKKRQNKNSKDTAQEQHKKKKNDQFDTSVLDELLKSPHIFAFADFTEVEEDLESITEKEQKNDQNTPFSLPEPENVIFGFSKNPIVFDYNNREVFSKSLLTVVCPTSCDLSQVIKPENTIICQDDKDYIYIKKNLHYHISSSEKEDYISPFSGSIYKKTDNLFDTIVNEEEPIILIRPSLPYQVIFQVKEKPIDWKMVKENTIIKSVPKEVLLELINGYKEETITAEFIYNDFYKFKTCKEQYYFTEKKPFDK
jgi:hypothetical protein